jgi:hypothetical protein
MQLFEGFGHGVFANLVLYLAALLFAIFCAAIILVFLVTAPLS